MSDGRCIAKSFCTWNNGGCCGINKDTGKPLVWNGVDCIEAESALCYNSPFGKAPDCVIDSNNACCDIGSIAYGFTEPIESY